MRLGAPVFGNISTPELWIAALQKCGYRAAYCPVSHDSPHVEAFARAAVDADIVIAEVGAWSNPLSSDETTRRQAITYCQQQLALADRIGALCCVNISGSRGEPWDGPHPDNLTDATFDLIVETTRKIIDAVQPRRAFYTLETMPWMYPDSAASYASLVQAIDRPQFAAHLDPVNLINCPSLYFNNAALLRDCFAALGPFLKGCHAKDVLLAPRLTTHIDEARPGLGALDYRVFLTEMAKLPEDTPLMLEHLPNEQEYTLAAAYIRTLAAELGLAV